MIYFIENRRANTIKIGYASGVGGPEKRRKMLQTGCSDPLHLIGSIEGCEAEERKLHRRFARHHVRGEWFKACDELREGIERLLDQGESGFDPGDDQALPRRVADAGPGVWSLPKWQVFAARCCVVTSQINQLIGGIPDTMGLAPHHINSLIEAADRWRVAMLGAEGVFARQHPRQEDDAIRLFSKNAELWAPCRGRCRPDAPKLSREEWFTIGRNLKAIKNEILDLMLGFQYAAGASKALVRRFIDAGNSIGSAKCKLDDLVCRQHRDWFEAARVFYGKPDDPLLIASLGGDKSPPTVEVHPATTIPTTSTTATGAAPR